ncbi:hypothetical protein GCM10023152_24610 [Agromyces bauzanensis]
MQQSPIRDIPQLSESIQDPLAISRESGTCEPANVLEHYCAWSDNSDLLDGPCEEVTLVGRAELLPGDREWGARNTPGEKVDALILCGPPDGIISDVADRNADTRVATERLRGGGIELDSERGYEARLMKPERLPPRARADFHG